MEKFYNLARNGLRLKLSTGATPFELNKEEASYGPDDWAWLFLRLNSEYGEAYKGHVADEDEDLSHSLSEQPPGLKLDHDGACASEFGLPVWLSPEEKELPKLIEKNDSWFFPLKRPISEDYRRTEVSSKHYKRQSSGYSRQLDRYPHILANEALFGYRKPPYVPIPQFQQVRHSHPSNKPSLKAPAPFDAMTLGLVWVAIDCSIPPDGQVSALADLAEKMRKALMAEGWKSNRESRDFEVVHTTKSDAFQHMKFFRAANATDKVQQHEVVWRAVLIDSLGPIGLQQEILLSKLNRIHLDLIAKGLAKEPRFQRFKNTLSSNQRVSVGDNKKDDAFPSSTSYLKALHTLAQLTLQGYDDPTEIAGIIGIFASRNHYISDWARHFHANLESHILDAVQMVNSGYRMLIHDQRPIPAT